MLSCLARHSYGTSSVRVVKVIRRPDRHDLKEIAVDVQFEGDYEASYVIGDNRDVLPTDTMKNTVYALAKDHPLEQIEDFGLALADHFLAHQRQLSRVRLKLAEHAWARLAVSGRPDRQAFARAGGERRVARVTASREGATVEAGIEELVVIKTAGSSFEGYIKDKFTTLRETSDRLLATAITASWTYSGHEISFGLLWHGVRQVLLETFAQHESRSVQHTLFAMGEAVLQSYEDISEIRLSLPNKHHLLVDLSPFGLENRNEIFMPTDEPYGLIEATLDRRGQQ